MAVSSPDQEARFLSGGTQQKLVLAKWLLGKSKLFIFDEPTRGIDVGAKAAIHALMNDLANQGAAILMISSELPEILGMSDRIYVMNKGRIVAERQCDQTSSEEILGFAVGKQDAQIVVVPASQGRRTARRNSRPSIEGKTSGSFGFFGPCISMKLTPQNGENRMFKSSKTSARLILFAILISVLAVAAVGPNMATAQGTFGREGTPVVAVVVKTLTGDVFQLKMAEAARDRARELGAEAEIYQAGGQTAVNQMVSIIEDLIQKQVDVIIISPLDRQAVVPAFEAAKAAGITVVLMDQGADGSDYATLLATDNYNAGAVAAEYAREVLGDQGQILVVEGAPGSEAGDRRRDGFKENVVKGGIEIVGSQSGMWTTEGAMRAMENMLQAQPDADLVYSCSDVMVAGVIEAIKTGRQGRQDQGHQLRRLVGRHPVHQGRQDPGDHGAVSGPRRDPGRRNRPGHLARHDRRDRAAEATSTPARA